jgi:hypothetical protein
MANLPWIATFDPSFPSQCEIGPRVATVDEVGIHRSPVGLSARDASKIGSSRAPKLSASESSTT